MTRPTSSINYSGIDPAFPIAGQDNDSQGFRDNFGAIQAALEETKTELQFLQTNSVLVADPSNATITNDLLGSTISNGLYSQLSGVFHPVSSVNTATDIDLNLGPVQSFKMTASPVTLTFRHWPDVGCATIRVHLQSDGNGTRAVTLSTENAGTMVYEASFPALTLNTNMKHKVIEAWSFDNGTHVYVRYIGEF